MNQVSQFADKVSFNPQTKAVVSIPCYAAEWNLVRTLSEYGKQNVAAWNFEILIFLNAGGKMDAKTYNTNVSARMQEIELVKKTYPNLKINTIDHHFSEKVSIGDVRAYLTETIAEGMNRIGGKDPIVIGNDADVVSIEPSYIKTHLEAYEKNPKLDYALGRIEWDTARESALSKTVPELFIGQRMLQVIDASVRTRWTSKSDANIGSSWANTSYKLSSYLAVGGYDLGCTIAEDVVLWRAFKAARYEENSPIVNRDYQAYLNGAKIQTSPRRAFDAILNGKTVAEQWGNFENNVGANLDEGTRIENYRKNPELLQVEDIQKAKMGDRNAIQKIRMRTEHILERLLCEYGVSDIERIDHFLKTSRIQLSTPIENLRFEHNPRGGITAINGLHVDMQKSPGLSYLFSYYQN